MTGRGAGFCAGFQRPGYANTGLWGGGGFGRGMALRRGGMGGFFRGFMPQSAAYSNQPAPQTSEKNYLKNELEYLENEMAEIKHRLEELGQDK
jgi:hypothetical protein